MFIFLPISCSVSQFFKSFLSKMCLTTQNTGITWELVSNAKSQTIFQKYLIRIWIFTRSPGYSKSFKIWVLSKKARKRSKVRNSTSFCYLLISFVCRNWKAAQMHEVILYIDNIGCSFLGIFVHLKNNGNLDNWIRIL